VVFHACRTAVVARLVAPIGEEVEDLVVHRSVEAGDSGDLRDDLDQDQLRGFTSALLEAQAGG